MTPLTEIQRLVLQHAAVRGDRILALPHGMRRADYLGTLLVARNLALELYSEPGWPIWRQDPAKRPVSLRITVAGIAALTDGNACHETVRASSASNCPPIRAHKASPLRKRIGQKQELALSFLQRRNGVALKSLAHAMGWQPHSARARLSGLRDAGYNIVRLQRSGQWVYRIDETHEVHRPDVAGFRQIVSDDIECRSRA